MSSRAEFYESMLRKGWIKQKDGSLSRPDSHADRLPLPVVERRHESKPMASKQRKGSSSPKSIRGFIFFTHYRKRIIDGENLQTKHIVDALVREARIFPDDSAKYLIHIFNRQVKSKHEKIEIEVYYVK